MPAGDYSDKFKAEALAVLEGNAGNTLRTSRELNIPESTLRSWKNGSGTRALSADLRDQKRTELADRLTDIAWNIVNSINDGDISKANLVQKSTAFGILLDKMRLLSNEATQISEVRAADGVRERIREKLLALQNGEKDE